MALIINSFHEFVDVYEPRPLLKLKPVHMDSIRANRKPAPDPVYRGGRAGSIVRCDECGAEFTARSDQHRFCCKSCRQANRRRMERQARDARR